MSFNFENHEMHTDLIMYDIVHIYSIFYETGVCLKYAN